MMVANLLKSLACGTSRVAAVCGAVMLAQGACYQLVSSQGLDLAVSGYAAAQETKDKPPEKTRRTPALRNDVYEKLSKAQAAAEEGDFNGAKKVLDDLAALQREGKKLNSYELANLYNFYAFICFEEENYKCVLDSYRKVLAQPDIPIAMENSTLYAVAQIYFVLEDYPGAIKAMNKWFAAVENPQPDAYVLLAQAYYQTKQFDLALTNVEKAMSIAKSKGKEPKENWYLLLRVLYYDKGNMTKVEWVLEELIKRWPKKDYFTQLSGIYGEREKEARQLSAMEFALDQGMLTRQQELLNMAYLFLGADTPWKAAKVVDKGLKAKTIEGTSKNYELLGNSLRAAQEVSRAIPAMEKAAKLSKKGEPWARLANIYLDNDQYGKAVSAARTALKRGKLRSASNTQIVLGMSLYNMKELDAARKEFVKLSKSKNENTKKMAQDWLRFLDNEIKRRDGMMDGLG